MAFCSGPVLNLFAYLYSSTLRITREISGSGILFLKHDARKGLRSAIVRISNAPLETSVTDLKNQAQFIAAQIFTRFFASSVIWSEKLCCSAAASNET